MRIEFDAMRHALENACADAGLDPKTFIVFVVDAPCPDGATQMSYFHPGANVMPETALVFRSAGQAVEETHLLGHRVAAWREVPGAPPDVLHVMVRHEVAHAWRWTQSGTRFFDADEELRALVSASDDYDQLPTEREANSASTRYAHRILAPERIAEIERSPFASLVTDLGSPDDVVEETLRALAEHPAWRPSWEEAERAAYLDSVRKSAADWPGDIAAELATGRAAPDIRIVAPAP